MSGMPPALQVTILVVGVLTMLVAVLIPVRLFFLFRQDRDEDDSGPGA